MQIKKHFLDKAVREAERLSPSSSIKKKLKEGWIWHKLTPAFASAGATAHYSRALISQDGTIAFVSDRANGPAASEIGDELRITHELLPLRVPLDEKEAAKLKGATWVSRRKTWACPPSRATDFAQWLSDDAKVFDLLQCE